MNMIGEIRIRKGLDIYTAGTCVGRFGLVCTLWQSKEMRSVEVFSGHGQQGEECQDESVLGDRGCSWKMDVRCRAVVGLAPASFLFSFLVFPSLVLLWTTSHFMLALWPWRGRWTKGVFENGHGG